MLKAAATSELPPALGFLCKDSEHRVTIETRQARKLWETTSFTAPRKTDLVTCLTGSVTTGDSVVCRQEGPHGFNLSKEAWPPTIITFLKT